MKAPEKNPDSLDINAVKAYHGRKPYREFLATEGIPIHEEYAVDCKTVEVAPWPRLGGQGAYVNLAGRSDYLSAYVHEIPPRGETKVEQHIFEKIMNVVSGSGATVVELPDGRKRTFEWGPGGTFSIPLNARHQHFNSSSSTPARLLAVTTMSIVMGMYRSPKFVFENTMNFSERFGDKSLYDGEGEFKKYKPGQHQWETNFVPDMRALELPVWHERGVGDSNNITFVWSDNCMHSHISEFESGTYKKAHMHHSGAHIVLVSGHGYSLLWKEGEDPVNTVRVDWKPGVLFAPPDGPTFHQHFNTSSTPARYLCLGPFSSHRWAVLENGPIPKDKADVSIKKGGIQVEYEDEDPRILDMFEKECTKSGHPSKMREFLNAAGVKR